MVMVAATCDQLLSSEPQERQDHAESVPDSVALEFHPAANEFPLLDEGRIDELADDIRAHGQREPIRTHRSLIVDGRNRYLACRKAGVEPRVERLPKDADPFAYVWSVNGERRDLTQDQRYLIWKSCAQKSGKWQAEQQRLREGANRARSESQKGIPKPRATERPATGCGRSSVAPRGRGSALRAAASRTNRGAVERMDRLQRERPDLADKVRTGEVTSAEAMRQVTRPHVAHNAGDNEWYTPAEYVDRARRVMGGIDLDPASSPAANEVVRAQRIFTADDDGLARRWSGRVFMNPPYAQPLVQQFTEKLLAHHRAGDVPQAVVLVNNATETRWFQTLLGVASAVCFPAGRVRFWHPEKTSAPLQGQAVLYCGHNVDAFAGEFRELGSVCHVAR
ncbi:MAG: DNA N-6-adenine-methyltransferase [Phycisphaerae bacterium]